MTLNPPANSHDHSLGRREARVTLVQYGDFQCPYSGAAYGAIKGVQEQLGDDLCYVFRHFPLADVHPHALQAAEAAEAAAGQGQFWPMHDLLFEHQHALGEPALLRYAAALELDMERFAHDLQHGTHRARVKASVAEAKRNGAHGTPTLFINGEFHDNREGLWDADALLQALERVVEG